MQVYISAPLFTEAERAFCVKVDGGLRARGVATYLPQRDGATRADPTTQAGREAIYSANMSALDACDVVLAVLDGAAVDEGVAFELGVATAWRKPSIGLVTDLRKKGGEVNLMLRQSLTLGHFNQLDGIGKSLEELAKASSG